MIANSDPWTLLSAAQYQRKNKFDYYDLKLDIYLVLFSFGGEGVAHLAVLGIPLLTHDWGLLLPVLRGPCGARPDLGLLRAKQIQSFELVPQPWLLLSDATFCGTNDLIMTRPESGHVVSLRRYIPSGLVRLENRKHPPCQ